MNAFSQHAMQRPSGMGPGPASDLSHLDLSSHLATQGSGGLFIEFFYTRVRFGGDSGPYAGKFETRLCVAKQPKGDRSTVAISYITEEQAMQHFPAEFHAFKTYQDTPTKGTPLHELPGVSQSMIAVMVLHGIRSIEDLVNLPADKAAEIGLDATTARNIALKWFGKRADASDDIKLAEDLAKSDAALAAALAELKALREHNQVLERTASMLQQMPGGAQAAGGMQNPMISAAPPMMPGQSYGADGAVMINQPDYDDDAGASDMGFGDPSIVSGLGDLPADPLA